MASASLDLRALLKKTNIEDHEAVLKASHETLKRAKNDPDAQHAKVVALLKVERYDDALRTLDAGGDRLKQIARFEHAYALYKTGSHVEAKDVAKSIEGDRGARHLEAQASYRLEEFRDAADIYQRLAETQTAHHDEENDLRINSSATDAQLVWKKQGDLARKKKPSREDLEVFETAYNAACGAIARDDLGQSEVLLKRAKDLCNALDELTDQQKVEELLPISVQQVYVLSRLGKREEAERLASDIALTDITDLSTRQVAQNDKLATEGKPSNAFLAHRIFHEVTSLPKTNQLFNYQAKPMRENGYALDLLVGKASAVLKSTLETLLTQPCSVASHINKLSVLHASAHAQNELEKIGLKEILPVMEKRPTDVGLALTIVQLYILTDNHGSALAVMESLLERLSSLSDPTHRDVRFAPGLISILVSLYQRQNRKSQVTSILAKAASYWRHKQKFPVSLLQAAGLTLLESSRREDQDLASEVFAHLRQSDNTSRFATAGYVAARAASSPTVVAGEADSLTSVPRLTADIDVLALETAGVPLPPAADASIAKRKRALDEEPKPTKKRIRKSRLPKDYDANKAPDSERWLPLRDRSSYKPKGKKGKKKAEALTQGGSGDGSKDGTKGAGEGVIQAKSGGGGKKKKGKK